jgi:hypothetical protein
MDGRLDGIEGQLGDLRTEMRSKFDQLITLLSEAKSV